MATEPVFDISVLIAPIPGPDPAGGTVPYPVRQKLRAARKDTEPHPEDPSQPDIPRKVDWKGIANLCQDTLTRTSKDLEVALQLTEAVTRIHGFAGVRDGLHFLADLVTQCWDRLHPIPEEGEGMEVRAERFNWIGEADYGARYPRTVLGLPLVKVGSVDYSLQDRKLALEGKGPIPDADFERAVPRADDTAAVVDEALAELTGLEQALQDKLADKSPSLMGLRQALEESQTFVQALLRKQIGQVEPAGDATGTPTAPSPRSPALGGLASREDAYRQLGNIADFLERLEPHSPIPDLLRRAIELGRLPFRKLVAQIVRDNNMLTEIRREFGLRDESSE